MHPSWAHGFESLCPLDGLEEKTELEVLGHEWRASFQHSVEQHGLFITEHVVNTFEVVADLVPPPHRNLSDELDKTQGTQCWGHDNLVMPPAPYTAFSDLNRYCFLFFLRTTH